MISANDIRKGVTFEKNNEIYQAIDFQHVKPARGAAFVRIKIRNIITGTIKEVVLNPDERFPRIHIENKEMEYLYNDGELYYFMDNETFEQLPLNKEQVEDSIIYIKENDKGIVKFYEGKPFELVAPNFVELEVTETEPGVKGNTATGATKPAIVETGATIQVPLFVGIGDKIKIDTRIGEYLSRV